MPVPAKVRNRRSFALRRPQAMTKRKIEIHESSGNVFAELPGFS
jgi:hypothetical protein